MKKEKFKTIKKIFSILIVFAFFFSFTLAINTTRAANDDPTTFIPSISIPGSDFQANQEFSLKERNTSYIGQYISAFYDYAIAIVGIVAVIVLMIGGIIWLTSGGNPSKIGQAKDLIFGSITGVALLLISWIMLNTINPDLVRFKVSTIGNIENIEIKYCCDHIKGPVVAEINASGSKIDYVCPIGSQICDDQCLQTEANEEFACLKESNFTCCEYTNSLNKNSCQTKQQPTACNPAPSGYNLTKSYPGHVCDPDGGESEGLMQWPCYGGGRACCQCKFNDVWPIGALSVECQDNLTNYECYTLCSKKLSNLYSGYSYQLFPSPAKCQSNGYCK